MKEFCTFRSRIFPMDETISSSRVRSCWKLMSSMSKPSPILCLFQFTQHNSTNELTSTVPKQWTRVQRTSTIFFMFYLPDLSPELIVNIFQLLQVFKHFLIARKHKKIRKQNIITIYNYKKKREEKDEWLVNLIVRTPQINIPQSLLILINDLFCPILHKWWQPNGMKKINK